MLDATLTKSKFADGTVEIRCSVENMTAEDCIKDRDEILRQRTEIRKIRPAAQIRKIVVRHEADSEGINLCKHDRRQSCRPVAATLQQPIPELGQAYWKGIAKTVDARACVLDDCGCRDFNISCDVEVIWEDSTDLSRKQQGIGFNTSLYVRRDAS